MCGGFSQSPLQLPYVQLGPILYAKKHGSCVSLKDLGHLLLPPLLKIRIELLRSLVVSLHLDLDPHDITAAELDHPNTCPEGLVLVHPLVKVADHCLHRPVVQWDMVGVDPEYLLPALSAGFPEDVVDVGKSLVNLVIDVLVDLPGLVNPAA